ncbi:MAG: glutaredoxin [Chloroflexi bacterium 44-23]|nr:MAG: glutaredoxin [Chloroflexi bacterium 44-23]
MTSKFLDDKIVEQVKEFFKDLNKPVKYLFFGSDEQNCQYCQDTQSLLTEITGISDKIELEVFDIDEDAEIARQYGVNNTPATVLVVQDGEMIKDYGVRFLGIPAGHEFTSLINSTVLISRQESNLAEETKQKLAQITKPVELKVFVTPTCPYCPRAVILAHQMAIQSDLVTAEMVEATEFVELSTQFGVSGVPHTVINMGAGEVVGAVPENNLMVEIERVLSAVAVE